MRARRRDWILPLAAFVSLAGLVVVLTFVPTMAPVGTPRGRGKLTIEHYIRSGLLLADIRTAAYMLQYIIEPDGPQPA
jgi:hypothetical protein